MFCQSPKSKSARGKSASKKSAAVKRQRTPAKKTGPPKKRSKKEVSDESESDADSDEKVQITTYMINNILCRHKNTPNVVELNGSSLRDEQCDLCVLKINLLSSHLFFSFLLGGCVKSSSVHT